MQQEQQKRPRTHISYPKELVIHNKLSYQLSRKYHYKHTSFLKVSFQFYWKEESHLLRKLKSPLIKLSKQLKSLRKLDFLECKIADVLPPKNMIQLAKAFNKIESLSIPCYSINQKHTYSALQWLKKATKLKQFNSPFQPYHQTYGVNQHFIRLEAPNTKILKELRRNRIQSIELSSLCPETLPSELPHLRKIRLEPKNYSHFTGEKFKPQRIPSWFSRLETLEILFPIESALVPGILSSIENPNQTNGLAFKLKHLPLFSDYDGPLSGIVLALQPFQSLKSFSLEFPAGFPKFSLLGLLELLKKFPLETLSLDLFLSKDPLKILNDSLIEFNHLKILKLNLKAIFPEKENISLIKSLGNFKKLEKLDFALDSNSAMVGFQGPIDELIISFSESIKNLLMLKELKLYLPLGNFATEFQHLSKALKIRMPGLKKLEIDFIGKEINPEDLLNFFHAFRDAKNLEVLSLHFLKILDENDFMKIVRDIAKAKNLLRLDLSNLEMKISRFNLVNAFEIILQKKGLEYFILESFSLELIQDHSLTEIPIKDLRQKNPNLKFVDFTVSMSEIMGGFLDLQKYKWE